MDVSRIVRECWGDVCENNVLADMHRSLADYGISSLQLITLMTSVCEASRLPLSALTEREIELIRTPADIVDVVVSHIGKVG